MCFQKRCQCVIVDGKRSTVWETNCVVPPSLLQRLLLFINSNYVLVNLCRSCNHFCFLVTQICCYKSRIKSILDCQIVIRNVRLDGWMSKHCRSQSKFHKFLILERQGINWTISMDELIWHVNLVKKKHYVLMSSWNRRTMFFTETFVVFYLYCCFAPSV